MSRIGKLPIEMPTGMEAMIRDGFIFIKNAKGELSTKLHSEVKINITGQTLTVEVSEPDNKKIKALWGLYRSLINNMVEGLDKGFEKKLEINGVGYRATVSGSKLVLNLGFSHPVDFPIPTGITATVEGNVIALKSLDKYLLGETAAQIRKIRKPEPYKGKGIKYVGEVVRRKAGKATAKSSA